MCCSVFGEGRRSLLSLQELEMLLDFLADGAHVEGRCEVLDDDLRRSSQQLVCLVCIQRQVVGSTQSVRHCIFFLYTLSFSVIKQP